MSASSSLSRPVSPGESFRDGIVRLIEKYCRQWWVTGSATPVCALTIERQRINECETDRIIDYFENELEVCPEAASERELWRAQILDAIYRFGASVLGLPESHLRILLSKPNIDVTRRFIHRAREFDPTVEIEALFQALRNVWIMNCIKIFFDRESAFSPSIFAYSMLYPYTDNFMDRPDVPREAKAMFSARLAGRLAGEDIKSTGSQESAVFRLVGLIEREFPRGDFPEVYWSLLAIHRAQVNSLLQQGPQLLGDPAEILRISVEKGGSSVLADGYLVTGTLKRDEADFCFGFGVLLQLLDDLQDLRSDLECEHWTIFSQCARDSRLDGVTSRLHRFMDRVLQSARCFSAPRGDLFRELIRRNCAFLLLRALAENQEFYSDGYINTMEAYSPLRFAYLRERSRTVQQRYVRVKKALAERKKLDSIFDVLN